MKAMMPSCSTHSSKNETMQNQKAVAPVPWRESTRRRVRAEVDEAALQQEQAFRHFGWQVNFLALERRIIVVRYQPELIIKQLLYQQTRSLVWQGNQNEVQLMLSKPSQ